MEEQHKILVIVNDDTDFSLIADNIKQFQRLKSLDICFLDVLKPTRKSKWLNKPAGEIMRARIHLRAEQLKELISSHKLLNQHTECRVLSGDLLQEVIHLAAREEYQLVLKSADRNKKKTTGRDLNFLRKCPVPFLLLKPTGKPIKNIVASIDIEADDQQLDHDLNRRIINASINVCSNMAQRLEIVSSWQLENESDLRDNPFFKISAKQLEQALQESQNDASDRLSEVVNEYEDNESQVTISKALVKGKPELSIPQYVHNNNIDLLVMGTVARAGLRGLLVGNTAEEILPNLECSILAVKPLGFTPSY